MAPFLNFRKYRDKTVMVVQAHTDDADYHCGATVYRLARRGAKVIYVVCTKGEKGTFDQSLEPDELVRIRREEQRVSNEILGVAETVHLDYPDGELKPTMELQGKIAGLIREHRPALLLAFDPSWPEHRMHPDHRASAVAAMRANVFGMMPNYFPEQIESGLEPYECRDILLYDVPRGANTFVPVGRLFRKKLDAMQSHESQLAYLLTGKQKRLVENLKKIPIDPLVQAVVGVLAPPFLVEKFRSIPVSEMLK